MNQLKRFFNEYKWVFLIAAPIYFGSGLWMAFNSYLKKEVIRLEAWDFPQHVAEEYMPDQRRRTKKWPRDLQGLPRHVKADEFYPMAARLNAVLKYHHNSFQKLEIVTIEPYYYTYRLHMKGRTWNCESWVGWVQDEDGGRCK